MQVAVALCGVAVLLGAAVLGVLVQRAAWAARLVYGICLGVCLLLLAVASARLLFGSGAAQAVQLPIGLPWSGAHFRLDALAAFFLAVVGLGGAGASLFAIGYGRHESAPGRVLPFYPAFLAGMTLVVLAHDASDMTSQATRKLKASWARTTSVMPARKAG